MKITVALICAIISVLFAVLFDFWVRKQRGSDKKTARIFAVVRGRIGNFLSFQYLPLAASLIIFAAVSAAGLGWKYAASFIAGAAAVIVPLFAGSFSFSDGVTAAYNNALTGDIRQALRAGFRSGASSGLGTAGICLAAYCIMELAFGAGILQKYAGMFALGAIVAAVVLHTGGEVYSSAYDLAAPSGDFTDRSGSYIASGADLSGSYVIAGAAAIALSDVAVATSGVTSTFTAGDAVRFPLYVYGAGLIASVIGIFVYRAGMGNDPGRGAGIVCITAGVITAALSVYLSVATMQTRVYAWAVATGIAAVLIITSVSRYFSYDSKLFLGRRNTDRKFRQNMSAVFDFGTGMASTAIFTVVMIAAVAVSYMFASYYGVALCAAGMCSILPVFNAVAGMSAVTGSVSEIITSQKETGKDDTLRSIADSLYSAQVSNLTSGKISGTASGVVTALASFCAFFYLTGEENIDIMALRVFAGIILGVSSAFLLGGLLIGSVRITGHVALRDIGRNDDDTGATSAVRGAVVPAVVAVAFPAVIGLFIGVKALAGFIIAAAVSGYVLITAADNSGPHFENTALQSLSSLIKMMAVFSVAFLPVFMKIGGFLFR